MAIGFRIPVALEEHAGLNRSRELLRVAVPLPKGLLRKTSEAMLVDEDGQPLASQMQALVFWNDRSIKWLTVYALAAARANERRLLFLQPSAGAMSGDEHAGIRITERGDNSWTIDTGAAKFEIGGNPSALLDAASVRGVDLLDPTGIGLWLLGCGGRHYRAVVERSSIEQKGVLRVAVASEGCFRSLEVRGARAEAPPLTFRSRVVFTAGSGLARVEVTLHNTRPARHPGGLWDLDDRGTLLFEDASLSLRPMLPARELKWYAERAGEAHTEAPGDWSLYQDSSGGENWDSENHVDGKGELTVTFRGYRVNYGNHPSERLIAEGDRASPALSILSDKGAIAATALEFWQTFPKALRWSEGILDIGLFPGESRAPFALQGGEQKRQAVLIDFLEPGADSSIPAMQRPLEVTVDAEWIEQSGAIDCFISASKDDNRGYLEYVQSIIEGPECFEAKRERIDEYGWRHFGDLYADHEAVGHTGHRPLISHYNNQYDFIHGALVHFLRTGDHRWWRLADPAARHTIDIDIYHTDGDKAAFNHGLFWHTDHYKRAGTCTHRTYSRCNGRAASYGGGPSNEHNYTSGLALYFCMTGDPDAAQAVRELADWVIAMDDGSRSVFAIVDSGPTGLASKTVDASYHKAGRGGGNSINALLDAWQICGERRYVDKAEELIRRCIHPRDDIEALRLTEPEVRWSYLVFLQVLGKYLHLKLQSDETDYPFHYARESLLHYARWMASNEVPYKDVLHKVEIPTETWPAQDMRKCHVLHVAAEFAPPPQRAALHERAAYFFERSLADVLSFETAYLTRPLVILAVCGYVHGYYQHRLDHGVEVEGAPSSFGMPQAFITQRKRWLAGLPGRARMIFKQVVRTGIERLDVFRWSSTPSRL